MYSIVDTAIVARTGHGWNLGVMPTLKCSPEDKQHVSTWYMHVIHRLFTLDEIYLFMNVCPVVRICGYVAQSYALQYACPGFSEASHSLRK